MDKHDSGVRREDYPEYEDYLRALHQSGEPIPDEVLFGRGGGFYGDLIRAVYGSDDEFA
ncbi:hypothetical protein ACVMII_003924 [Bradyrhizobium diazoefficiens]